MTTPPPALEPLPYASPPPVGPRRAVFSWGVFLWSGAILTAWTAILLFVVPGYKERYMDYKMELPGITVVLLRVAQFAAAGGWVALPIVPLALGFLCGPLGPVGRWAARAFITLLFGALILFTIAALALPMQSLLDAMSNHR